MEDGGRLTSALNLGTGMSQALACGGQQRSRSAATDSYGDSLCPTLQIHMLKPWPKVMVLGAAAFGR